MAAPTSSDWIKTSDGLVCAISGEELRRLPEWERCFKHLRRDHRYYNIIEQTIGGGFEYSYFVLKDNAEQIRAVQPFFIVDQDLIAGLGERSRTLAGRLRCWFPRMLRARTLMVGCAAGEGHLSSSVSDEARWIARTLHEAVRVQAKRMNVSLVVFKEFPATYRESMRCLSLNGYAHIPSMPMVRLPIAFESFEDYMDQKLSKVTRKSLRRKFKKLAGTAPIEMQVVSDVTPFIEEIYPLYLQVFERATMSFEKLTKDYFCRLGQSMPDRVRFFIWRQSGKAIAFSLCLVHDGAIYDEYIGMQYPVALDLHLYYITLRDIIEWGIANGCKTYYSSALNYDPKLHLKCDLVPLDLYVHHTSPVVNFLFRRILPIMGPTRSEPLLHQFPNAHEMRTKRAR